MADYSVMSHESWLTLIDKTSSRCAYFGWAHFSVHYWAEQLHWMGIGSGKCRPCTVAVVGGLELCNHDWKQWKTRRVVSMKSQLVSEWVWWGAGHNPSERDWGWQSWQQLCGEATLKNARACQNKRPRIFSRLDIKPCYRHGSLKVKDMTEQFNRIIQMLINVFYIILMSSYRFMTLRARFDWDACERERDRHKRRSCMWSAQFASGGRSCPDCISAEVVLCACQAASQLQAHDAMMPMQCNAMSWSRCL